MKEILIQLRKDIASIVKAISYVSNYKKNIVFLLIIELVLVVIDMAQPFLMGSVVDQLNNRAAIGTIGVTIAIMWFAVLLNDFITGLEGILLSNTNFGIENYIKEIIFKHYLRTGISSKQQTSAGELIERIDQDTQVFPSILLQLLCGITTDILTVIFYFVLLCKINSRMLLLQLIMFPVAAVINIMYGNVLRKINVKYKKQKDRFLTFVSEVTYGKKTIYNFKSEGFFLNKYIVLLKELFATKLGAAKKKIGNSLSINILTGSFYVLLLFVGVYEIKAGRLTVGLLITFMTYTNIFSTSVMSISRFNVKIQEAAVSVERVREFLNGEDADKNTEKNRQEKSKFNSISLQNVTFGYEQRNVLNAINVSFERGKLYSIIGKSGEGKSTLFDLISGNLLGYDGHIYMDGKDIKEIDRECLREAVCYISQKDIIFSESVKDNILFGKNVSEATLEELGKKVYLNDDINQLEKKYDTIIGQDGCDLSNGQKQRIMIARAFAKENACIYLFDEITSGLDDNSEQMIIESMKALSKNNIVINISHKVNVVKASNVIIEIENGSASILSE